MHLKWKLLNVLLYIIYIYTKYSKKACKNSFFDESITTILV